MKIQVGKLVNSWEALQDLTQAKLPATVSMRVALVVQAVRGPITAFETGYNALLADTGVPREKEPGKYDITDKERFARESSELLAAEVEVSVEPIEAKALGSAEIKPATLLALDWLIKL